jgi:type VII secretion integral membrane protein EccD
MPTVSFPARCAVAVVCGEHLVSQVYPASVPVEVFLDNIVELLDDDLKRRGASALDSGVAYELQRANGTRLDVTKTLDELGIEDGTTLVLVPAEQGESFEPQYESLSTGLARVGKRLFEPVTAHTAATTSLAVLAMMVLTTLGLAVHLRDHSDSWVTAAVLLVLGAAVAFGAFAVWRWWPDRWQLIGGLGWLAVPLLAVGLAAAAPGRLGGAHLFIAALGVAVLTCGLVAVTGRYATAASTVVTLCVVGGLVAAVRMWHPVAAQRLGMLTLVGLLVLITAGPTIALWVGRIRPPHFGSITGRDLFRRSDGMPVDAVAPVDEDIDDEPSPDVTPRGAVIAAAARRANSVLTGICVGAAIALPVAVWATLMPGQPRGTGAAVLALLFVLIFISRGRSFADRRQAVALVCGAAGAVCAAVGRYVLHAPADAAAPLLWGTLVLTGFAAAGLAAALLVPVTRFTPLVRMTAEWLELAAIVVALPLAAWVGGLFAWVRMR